MITINKSLLVGKGHFRTCYQHPEDNNLCIKVSNLGDSVHSHKEFNEYMRLVNNNVPTDLIADLYQIEPTDLGERLICELVWDFDGKISNRCSEDLNGEFQIELAIQLKVALERFKKYVYDNYIILRDLNSVNLLFQRISETEGNLIIIDGLGNNDYIPIANYWKWWAKKKIDRKWIRFIEHLYKHCPESEPLRYIMKK